MIDKFKEWLESMAEDEAEAKKQGAEEDYSSVSAEDVLKKYREFLEEQSKPKTNSELAMELEKIETEDIERLKKAGVV